MTLTDEEKKLVLEHRARQKEYADRRAKQASCQHDWTYRGEWRGDSHYECFRCGDTKFD
jgi:muconolactone delta-isomerase